MNAITSARETERLYRAEAAFAIAVREGRHAMRDPQPSSGSWCQYIPSEQHSSAGIQRSQTRWRAALNMMRG
jgi:hypothetical protein